MEAIERVRGFACEVDDEQWAEIIQVADEVGCKVNKDSRKNGTEAGVWPYATTSEGEDGLELITFHRIYDDENQVTISNFLSKLKGEQQDIPFAEQVAANIIKISCNKDTPYADKMKMVVQAILEFERNPKSQQPKNEKA